MYRWITSALRRLRTVTEFDSTRARIIIALIIGIVAGLSVAASGIGGSAEGALQQWRNAARAHSASGKLVLVEIDAKSLRAVGAWPWPRRLHAAALDALNRAGAQTIAFDVDFSAASTPADDERLAAAIARSKAPVVLPTFRQSGSETQDGSIVENLPLPRFAQHAQLATVNIQADEDGLVRSYPFGLVTGNMVRPSVGALLADASGGMGRSAAIDGAIVPETVPRISFGDLLHGRVPDGSLRGRSVLIGATAIELGDRYSVPGRGVLPGPLIQLLAAETLLQGTSPVDRGPLPMLLLVLAGLPFLLRRSDRAQLCGGAVAALAIGGVPLVLEVARLGTMEIIPAEATLFAAIVQSAILSAMLSAREARLNDADTGLPNRRALQRLISLQREEGVLVAVRIDGYGTAAGVLGQRDTTEMMKRITERLSMVGNGLLYRIEESSLAWWLPRLSPEEQAERIDTAAAMLRQPIEVAARRIELGYAFGLVEADADLGTDAVAHALLAADHALASGQRWQRYTAEINQKSDWQLSLVADLDAAIAAGDIWVAYQPKLNLRSNRIDAVEALVRWNHPTRGQIPPDAFIPALEESGRILELTVHVLNQALRDLAAWTADGCEIAVAVNVSALLPGDPAFFGALRRAIADARLPANLLTLEVTESATMTNSEAAIRALEAIAALGVRLSIDDYGTGQSTLSYLKRLPGSEIKIDKSFVLPLQTSRSDQLMVRSTIELAHELGYKVVAEGVESGALLDLLRDYGCDVAQGWHIGRPMPATELGNFITAHRLAA